MSDGDGSPGGVETPGLGTGSTEGDGYGPDDPPGPDSAVAAVGLGAWTLVSSVAVGLVGLGVGFVLAVGAVGGLAAAGVEASPLVVLVVSLVLVQGLAFGGVALGYVTLRDRVRDLVRGPVERTLGVRLDGTRHDVGWLGLRLPTLRDAAAVGLGYVGALGLGVGGAVLVSTVGLEAGSNQAADLAARDPSVLLLLIPASFLLIGPGEELLFRGIVQSRLRGTFGAPAAVALASVVFAAVHYVALSGSPSARLVTVGVLVGPALVFGTTYELTENLVVPSLIHGAYNATLFGLLYLALRFGPDAAGPALLAWV
jgi:membrane protease YdiL (CAAX protease family)